MKTSLSNVRQRGSALVTTLVLALLVAIAIGALLVIAQQQNTLTNRSMVWCSEIPMAEAGIEEAMTHINSRPTNWAANGWSLSSSNYVKRRYFTNAGASVADGYFYAAISTSRPPTIVSVGYGRVPLNTNYTHRTVAVMTRRNNAGYGVVAKGTITMSGGAFIDSFDSSSSAYSSNGLYTISRRRDGATVGSLSSANPAVTSGTGKIYGSVATGVGGTVGGNVGDGTWLTSNSGVQSGHASDDFNMAIPDVQTPTFTGSWPAVNAAGQYVLTTGDWVYSSSSDLNIGGGKSIIVAGPGRVRFYVANAKFTTSGSGFIKILAGASFELYLGDEGTISGSGIVNDNQNATQCAIYGLPTCTVMTYSGSAQYIGTVYTPQAAFTFSGGQGAAGSFVANTMTLSGSAGVHYDEALGNPGVDYSVISWEELSQ